MIEVQVGEELVSNIEARIIKGQNLILGKP